MGTKYILPVVVTVVVVLAVLLIMKTIRKNRQEERRKTEDRMREDALDKLITNQKSADTSVSAKPVEINYKQAGKAGKKKGKAKTGKTMVQITERNDLSERKFFMDPMEVISIGNRQGKSSIVVMDSLAQEVQCEIFKYQDDVVIRSKASGIAILNRRKKSTAIGEVAMVVEDGDVITIGQTRLEIKIVSVDV